MPVGLLALPDGIPSPPTFPMKEDMFSTLPLERLKIPQEIMIEIQIDRADAGSKRWAHRLHALDPISTGALSKMEHVSLSVSVLLNELALMCCAQTTPMVSETIFGALRSTASHLTKDMIEPLVLGACNHLVATGC